MLSSGVIGGLGLLAMRLTSQAMTVMASADPGQARMYMRPTSAAGGRLTSSS